MTGEKLHVLAEEQAALRRLATLVASGAPPEEVFAAAVEEVGRVLAVDLVSMGRYEPDRAMTFLTSWGAPGHFVPIGKRLTLGGNNLNTIVFETGRSARIDSYDDASGAVGVAVREGGVRAAVGAPIVVEGRLWGMIAAGSSGSEPLPPDTEARLASFTELLATAIANAESRAALTRLADEQAALRRVATLVARGAPPEELFAAVVDEVGRVFPGENVAMARYESDATMTVVAVSKRLAEIFPAGSRWPLGGTNVSTIVAETGRPARNDSYGDASGRLADAIRERGRASSVGAPIVAEGRVWGVLGLSSTEQPLPADIEARLASFTELLATAIANADSRAALTRMAEEQAALRRVATLVAEESSPAEVFAKVAEEVASVLGDVDCALIRDEGDGTGSAVATWGANASKVFPVGARLPLDGDSVATSALREGRPSRIDDYSAATGELSELAREIGVRSAVACPIVVGGRTWGAMAVASYVGEPLPAETESRVAQFSDLVATSIANAATRAEVQRLADEQAALGRVATLAADGASPTALFDAVAAEMEELLGADRIALNRFESDTELTVVAHRGSEAWRLPPGSRVSHEGETVSTLVRRTEGPVRIDEFDQADETTAEVARALGVNAAVAAPIFVEGRLWGTMVANWHGEKSPPADTEERMATFAQLLDTAIANADSREQLTASRTRLLTAGDEARRRVVRDLHDGAQQRLVHTIITLKLAQHEFREDRGKAEALIGEALGHAEQGNAELRELAHGILPEVLTSGGLRAGVNAMTARLDVPVHVDLPAERFGPEIEASAYFLVAESLTNVVKHAHADRAEVRASVHDGMLHLEIRDDGIGGADPHGRGLMGMDDRLTALGGRLEVDSPAGGGTRVAATLPLPAS